MTKYQIPYGKGAIDIELNNNVHVQEINPPHTEPMTDPVKILIETFENPIGTKNLKEILNPDASEKKIKTIAVVMDDNTRKFPNKIILPPFLKYLDNAGIKKEQIKIIIAGGTHKPPTPEHIKEMTENILNGYEIITNDQKSTKFIKLGTTSRGSPVLINEHYLNADVKILLTDITLHYFAGFGGDRKSIYPGLAAAESINANHRMVTEQGAVPGILENNPIHEDMLEGARMAGADFVVNICLNEKDEIFDIKSGALNDAFLRAVENYKKYFCVPIAKKADVLILSQGGHPYDINFYQSQKAIQQCRNAVKPGGIILYFTESKEGIGNPIFGEGLKKCETAEQAKASIHEEFIQGKNNVYYQRKFVEWYKFYLKTELPDKVVLEDLKMNPVNDVQKKIDELTADAEFVYVIKKGSKITVLTDDIQ